VPVADARHNNAIESRALRARSVASLRPFMPGVKLRGAVIPYAAVDVRSWPTAVEPGRNAAERYDAAPHQTLVDPLQSLPGARTMTATKCLIPASACSFAVFSIVPLSRGPLL
jgi:hypothetical protein